MIGLGSITVRTEVSVIEARRKIQGLALALGFNEIDAVRLATATSQLCRMLASSDGSSRVEAAVRVDQSRTGLELSFLGRGDLAANGTAAAFFDLAEPLAGDAGLDGAAAGGLRTLKWLPRGADAPSSALLEAQRTRLQQRSREELMEEVRAQNEALERHSAALEQTVAERTLELRQAMESADAANRAKSEFLSNMSHELRTPLNGVLGYAQILQRDPAVTPKQRRSLESIHNCGQHLLTLINDVLDLSKIEAGRLELEVAPCDLSQLLKSVYDIVRPRAESRGLEFMLEIEPGVPAGLITDKTKLKQTIVNLAGNAVKFTEQGSITLRARREGREVVFEVQDTGIGMTPEEAAAVFDPFKQAEGGKKHGGTGLGLAISKRIIEAMGGSIGVVSSKGTGSTFTVRLPLEEAEVARPVADMAIEDKDVVLAPGQDVHVLIADDVPANRDILVTILGDAGFRTTEAENGRQAIELLRQHRCQLALMDVRMPIMDGLQATAAIRADPEVAATKLIAVTASVIDFKDRAAEHGFDDLLGKPVRVEELFDAIRRHLSVRYVERRMADAPAAAVAAPPADAPEPPRTLVVPAVAPPPEPDVAPEIGAAIATRLRAALRLQNLTAINGLCTELTQHPATSSLGQRIGELAHDFNFKGLDQLAARIEAAAGPAGSPGP